jgi:two-component system, LytTR family, response regulator
MKNYIENSQEAAYLKADESYSILFWANGQKLVKPRPMKHYAASFEAQGWCRIHRSYMVNPVFITHITPDREHIRLHDGTELPIARRKKKNVLKWRKNYTI